MFRVHWKIKNEDGWDYFVQSIQANIPNEASAKVIKKHRGAIIEKVKKSKQ